MKKALSIGLTGLLAAFSLFVASCLVQAFVTMNGNFGIARIYGHSFLYVATDSMVGQKEDSLPVGTGVIVRQVDPGSLHAGDIVSFYDYHIRSINTHRLDREPERSPNGYILHTMADNVESVNYTYEGETFSDAELLGLVVGHNDALGSFLSFVSPAASGAKEATGNGVSMAWLFPLLAFLPIVGVLSFQLIKLWKKEKKAANGAALSGNLIESLPNDPEEETSLPLDEDRFKQELEKALTLHRYPHSALLAIHCPKEEKNDALISLKETFSPRLLGEWEGGFLLFLSPMFVFVELEAKAKKLLAKHAQSEIGIAFYPETPKEELVIAAISAKGEDRFGVVTTEITPQTPQTIERSLKEALSLGFHQATLYLRSSTNDSYIPYAEAAPDGYYEAKDGLTRKPVPIEAFLVYAKEGEIGLVMDGKDLPVSHGASLSFYVRPFEGGAVIFLRNRPISPSPEQIDKLLKLSDFLANQGYFLKQEQEKNAGFARLECLLDSEKQYAYEVDCATHRLTYVSEALRQKIPSLSIGTLCHKALYGTLSSCPRCPLCSKEGVKKVLPVFGSQTLHFLCLHPQKDRALIRLSKAKSKTETPLSFIEEFETMLRASKTGLILLIQAEAKEEERRYFNNKAKASLSEAEYGEGLFDYDEGLAYLLPNLTSLDAVSMIGALGPIFSALNAPPLSFYRFAFPEDVTCRLELEATLRALKRKIDLRGTNAFVE